MRLHCISLNMFNQRGTNEIEKIIDYKQQHTILSPFIQKVKTPETTALKSSHNSESDWIHEDRCYATTECIFLCSSWPVTYIISWSFVCNRADINCNTISFPHVNSDLCFYHPTRITKRANIACHRLKKHRERKKKSTRSFKKKYKKEKGTGSLLQRKNSQNYWSNGSGSDVYLSQSCFSPSAPRSCQILCRSILFS